MPPRAFVRRVLLLPVFFRAFSRSCLNKTFRPQIPFLSQPSKASQQVRWQTTGKRRWLSQEFRDTIYYTSYFAASAVLWGIMVAAIKQELAERKYPSPPEWSFWTRYNFRMAIQEASPSDPNTIINWVVVLGQLANAVDRLEKPDLDGDDVVELVEVQEPRSPWQSDQVIYPKDITKKSDKWRQGYYETLLVAAKAAEHVDGWVWDRSQKCLFPPQVVLGPSNPKPKPVPRGMCEVPREENCHPAKMPTVQEMYDKLSATVGFTPIEQMNATLQYATFLDYKNRPGEALVALEKALDLADKGGPGYSTTISYDPETLTIPEHAKPSANHLTVLTSIATLKARNGAVEEALPMLISILRARRQLPMSRTTLAYPQRKNVEPPESLLTAWEKLEQNFGPPPYPGRFPDGSIPPTRDAAEQCQEAALNAYIGEIMFARGSRESGLAWTREAVDISEEQMHNIQDMEKPGQESFLPDRIEIDESVYRKAALKHCRECLNAGLANWKDMVEKMTQIHGEEAEKKNEEQKQKWISWGSQPDNVDGRWEAEIKVVEDRQKRAEPLLNMETYRPTNWFDFMFVA